MPGAAGRSRPRCGTSPGRRSACPARRCWAAPSTACRPTRRWVSCARPGRAPSGAGRCASSASARSSCAWPATGSTRASRAWPPCARPSATRWRSSSTSTSGGGCRATSRPGSGRQAARRVVERLAEHAVLWVEEPLPGSDLAGHAHAARADRRRRSPAARWPAPSTSCSPPYEHDALDVFQPDVVLALGHVAGRARWPSCVLHRNRALHPAHVDQRPRPARQPARGVRRRRRPVPRVPLRSARLDRRSAATSCSPSRSASTPTAACASRSAPASGAVLDEAAIARGGGMTALDRAWRDGGRRPAPARPRRSSTAPSSRPRAAPPSPTRARATAPSWPRSPAAAPRTSTAPSRSARARVRGRALARRRAARAQDASCCASPS